MKQRTLGILTVLGLVIAAVGIVAPIVWDRYKTKAALELRLISNSIVVSPAEGLEKLQFSYDGAPVKSLTRLEFALVNTGRTPIRQADIVSPPSLRISNGEILDVRLGRQFPEHIEPMPIVDSARHTLSITFPLFNAGDAVYFTVLVASEHPDITAEARITGIGQLVYVIDESSPWRRPFRVSLPLLFVGLTTTLAGFLVLAGLFVMGQEAGIADALKYRAFTLPTFKTRDEYVRYLDKSFKHFKSAELSQVKTYLTSVPEIIDDSHAQELQRRLATALTDYSQSKRTLAILSALIAVGTIYLLTRLF